MRWKGSSVASPTRQKEKRRVFVFAAAEPLGRTPQSPDERHVRSQLPLAREPSSFGLYIHTQHQHSDLHDFMEEHHEIGALLTLAREAYESFWHSMSSASECFRVLPSNFRVVPSNFLVVS